jgi:hypothetical protein
LKLVRKQIYITPSQDRGIKQLAMQQGITESAILRKVLDQFLAREGILEMQDPFADLIGIFVGPLEVNHDDIYR